MEKAWQSFPSKSGDGTTTVLLTSRRGPGRLGRSRAIVLARLFHALIDNRGKARRRKARVTRVEDTVA